MTRSSSHRSIHVSGLYLTLWIVLVMSVFQSSVLGNWSNTVGRSNPMDHIKVFIKEQEQRRKELNQTVLPANTNSNVNDIKPRVLIYVLFHDEKSKEIALNYTRHNPSWTKPVYIPSTKFFESITYRNIFPFHYEEWKDLDYVGMMSYKVATTEFEPGRYHPKNIYEEIVNGYRHNYDIVPLLRSTNHPVVHIGTKYHGKHFKIAWDAVLTAMGFDEDSIRQQDSCHAFYRSAFATRPVYLKWVSTLMSDAIEVSLYDDNAVSKLSIDAGYPFAVKEVAQRIFHKPYYEYHPFVFERLPVFFFNVIKAEVCIGDNSPCRNNFA